MTRRVAAARMLQEGSLYLLLFMLSVSKAAIEVSFLLLSIGWWLERLWAGGWRSSVWSSRPLRGVGLALIAYLAVCAASITVSTSVDHSLQGFFRKTLEYASFMVMAADAAVWIRLDRVLAVFFSSSAVVGADAVVQELTGRDPLLGHTPYLYGRMTGPYENPSDLATYLAVALLMALGLLKHPSVRRPPVRAGLWALVVLLGGCLVRTESQSAWIGFAAGAVLIVACEPSLRRPFFAVGAVFALAAGILLGVEQRLWAVLTLSDVGVRDRWHMWQAGWRMVADRPILGLGLNTFMANYLTYWVGGEQQPRYAHNCYLQTAAETGLLGLAAFATFLYLLFRRGITALARATETQRPVLLGLSAGLLAFAVQAAADTNFYALRQAALFWTLAGIGLGVSVRAPDRAATGQSK